MHSFERWSYISRKGRAGRGFGCSIPWGCFLVAHCVVIGREWQHGTAISITLGATRGDVNAGRCFENIDVS